MPKLRENKGWRAAEVHGKQIVAAPHVDRLLGDVAALHSPFFGSGKLEYYLATRRPGLKVRSVDAFEPVANLHRCYLRQDPVFLCSLLRLAGREIDRRFPPAGHSERPRRAPGCLLIRPAAQQLLGKVGLLHTAAPAGAEQRAAYAAASRQAIYADPPYIFPGRSMNYYGTRRRGHVRDALFFLVCGAPWQAVVSDPGNRGGVPRQADVSQAQLRRLFGLENGFRSTAHTWSRFSAENKRIFPFRL